MANSADPDQLASSEANWSGSKLFAKIWHVVFSKRRVKSIGVALRHITHKRNMRPNSDNKVTLTENILLLY